MMGILTRVRAATSRTTLDRLLAGGADPQSSPELACRARVLQRWRARHTFANGLESIVRDADSPPHRHGASAPIAREEVLDARADLLRAAAALRADRVCHVRGIAEVSLLLTDGAGPMFRPHPHGALRASAVRAAFHLEAG